MRYAGRPRNSSKMKTFNRLLGIAFVGMALAGCSTLGLGSDRGGPDLTGSSASEVNWSFADAERLNDEIAALKSENDRLKSQVQTLERQKSKAQAEVAALIETQAQSELAEIAGTEGQSAVGNNERSPTKAVVAAADVDGALKDAPTPVAESPRLVQPSFSDEKTVFENEATAGGIRLSSVLYGVHLASYKTMQKARDGWSELQRRFPDELGLLEPRVELVDIPERGEFLRLIGGGFSSESKANELCQRLTGKGRYCSVAGFSGQRLSRADASG